MCEARYVEFKIAPCPTDALRRDSAKFLEVVNISEMISASTALISQSLQNTEPEILRHCRDDVKSAKSGSIYMV